MPRMRVTTSPWVGWLSRDGAAAGVAPRIAVKLSRKTASWAFARVETFRVTASLDLLGALPGVIVLLLVDDFSRSFQSTGLLAFACGADSQGNSFLLEKRLTTKYPLGLIPVELSYYFSLRRATVMASGS